MTMTDDAPTQELTRIDAPIDKPRLGDIPVDRFAGLSIDNYRQAIEFSKVMALAVYAIPKYLKKNEGDCLAIVTKSLRWRLEPYWVAENSYVARAEGIISYSSAVFAAIILSSGLLKERPRYIYSGEGEERRCTVRATFRGETEPVEYITPPLRQCRPPKNEQGVIKGSPLWVKDPDQQLGYYAIRNWGRRHCPEVLGGVYDRDEFEETTQDALVDVTPPSPRLMDRLPGKVESISGYQPNVVDQGLAKKAEAMEEAKAANRKEAQEAIAAEQAARSAKATEKPHDTPAPAPQADPAPQAEKPRPELPQDAGAYMAWAAKWIEVVADEEELKRRWDDEKDMRADLKVPLASRKRLEAMLHGQINMVKQGKKR